MQRALGTMGTMGLCCCMDHRGRRFGFLSKGSEGGHLAGLGWNRLLGVPNVSPNISSCHGDFVPFC